MEPIFQQDFQVQDMCVDRYGRLKPSTLLYFAQEIAGRHCDELADTLEAAVAGRVYAVVFAPGRSRKDDVGIFAGLVEEDILDDDPAPGTDQPAPGTG